MSNLEREMEALNQRVGELMERVRLDAVAEAFLRADHTPREGDVFLCSESTWEVYRLGNISSDGKWTVSNMNGQSWEPHMDGREYFKDAKRMYSAAEVAEIVAKIRRALIPDNAPEAA